MAAFRRSGELLEDLEALADWLAGRIEACDSDRDAAALARQYRETIRAVDALKNGEDSDDEVAAIIIRNRKSAADGKQAARQPG